VGCDPAKAGCVTITDMDFIELSNLSRQFLFRQSHVESKRSKSSVAAEAARAMNVSLNIVARELKVGPDTENIFNEHFWARQTAILNALDNMPARLYVDEQCVHNQRPLFESGTNGPKLNTQCVIPFLTENYGATRDPPEKEYALCTLKNFPNAIEHTIHWAKEAFGTEFTSIPGEVMSYVHSNAQWRAALARDPSSKSGAIRHIVAALAGVPRTWADCVAWARLKFEDYFANEIKQLMYNLPVGTVRDGKPVWGGAKRPPTPAVFSAADAQHVDFIIAAASLRAVVFGLTPQPGDRAGAAAIAAQVTLPEWKPRVQEIAVKDEDEKNNANNNAAAAASAEKTVTEADLPPPGRFESLRLKVQDFEKDDDENFHVDFVAAVSNLRATNYGIPTVSRDHTKFIAGKIIPAMITTTAAATGLVGLEFLKYMCGAKDLQQYRNSFMNLAVPLFNNTPPTRAAKAKSYMTSKGTEVSFTNWDRIDIGDGTRDLRLEEIVDALKQRYDIDTDMISTSTAKLLYTGPFTKKDKMQQTVTQILEGLGCPVKDDAETVALIATGTSNDVDVDIPPIQYRFRGSRK
jgi:ubiquitin-activating enzyme E1